MVNALGITLEEYRDTQNGYLNTLEKSTDFLPVKYLRHIAHTYSYPFQKLHDIYYNPELFRASLYPDTIPALDKLKHKNTLGIYSEGNHDFQITKLKLSGIFDYFDPNFIFIHRRKIDPVIISSLPENTTIVDDRTDVIDSLSQYANLSLVWLNRKDNSQHPFIQTVNILTSLTL
jgi:phosphoglycolate phosphatase-like HAD superfamily hydrolase